ncbi:AbrB/MazE/SpoVT family DNA-binding domain-containing protein [Thermosulfuriphilus ammonigenes]|uniref:AbrB/MazE/SpoVT family DNA-binding domain-containing protein n=2 Tax=Thermodesulfobacteriales TaxID=188710 RepID=A0A6G7PV00_9BACT|nr:AbrB/MazE/SpoVT family DNA-binding domain-containing protein [Thermosulfuriphilus ammonigenes]MBA2848463.1 bifunctional DNA-binding transcriptional regulator/antitoxin component of YhaV-PrlF toxin-antitoxin module [Thermosulfuriphilus ammonigenes]QIJ71386.1 AbrB/MazE/SpoVT family DNA-binding domain-containing protein [Thermosulfuriphilus ammonigenes]HHI97861.1 AbrB/MazE/SpoVT family DNA-binding domain-containing protein [Thermodesulfatator atlanticus]
MLAKLSAKNQITIPKKILEKLPPVKYFEISLEDGVIVLRPIPENSLSLTEIRKKMKKLGITEETVAEAIKWARKR